MEIINKRDIVFISNTNYGNGNKFSAIKFYDNNEKFYELRISRNNPLEYLMKNRTSKYWNELYEKMLIFGIEKLELDKIMELRYNKVQYIKQKRLKNVEM